MSRRITKLRFSGKQHASLQTHLFPGDGNEAVALALCGRRSSEEQQILACQRLIPVPYDQCIQRTAQRVQWKSDVLEPLFIEASQKGVALVKIHSHPTGYPEFSSFDDVSDGNLFRSLYGWVDSDLPHASCVMLPDGSVFGRAAFPGGTFGELRVVIAGDDIVFSTAAENVEVGEFTLRNQQLFGRRTVTMLKELRVGVVGCSGTGSPTVEQLTRLGVGELVLVDPDVFEVKNQNRIVNGMGCDLGRLKVDVLGDAVERMGLGTKIHRIPQSLSTVEAVLAIASCDVVFGCMDGLEGRHVLSRIASHYVIPYFDVGVKLFADGQGGVSQVCGAVHYIQPGGSSLLSRGVYTLERLRAAARKRADPLSYAAEQAQGYIERVEEESPAVISVNMQMSAIAVNEFLARLHPYRNASNSDSAITRVSLTGSQIAHEPDGEPCALFSKLVGLGDTRPLVGLPSITKVGAQ